MFAFAFCLFGYFFFSPASRCGSLRNFQSGNAIFGSAAFVSQRHALGPLGPPPVGGLPPTWAACQHIVYQMQSWQPLTMTCSERSAKPEKADSFLGVLANGCFGGAEYRPTLKKNQHPGIASCSVCHAFCGQIVEFISHTVFRTARLLCRKYFYLFAYKLFNCSLAYLSCWLTPFLGASFGSFDLPTPGSLSKC